MRGEGRRSDGFLEGTFFCFPLGKDGPGGVASKGRGAEVGSGKKKSPVK